MPTRPNQNAAEAAASNFSTPVSTPAAPLKGSRWQLITASVMLALWIAFLIAMAVFN